MDTGCSLEDRSEVMDDWDRCREREREVERERERERERVWGISVCAARDDVYIYIYVLPLDQVINYFVIYINFMRLCVYFVKVYMCVSMYVRVFGYMYMYIYLYVCAQAQVTIVEVDPKTPFSIATSPR